MLVHKENNSQVSIELTASLIHDLMGMVVGAVLVFRDVTKIRSLTKQLVHQATHDALTSLPNRVEFENRVEQSLRTAQSGMKKHAIFYIDLDQFKAVNDTAGHHAGDRLLQQLANLMQDLLRRSDTLARLGGDEFGVLLPGCPLSIAEEIAEKMRAKVEEFRFVWEGDVFRVGLSIGVVPMLEQTSGLTELMQAADSACYVAKERGRNYVHVFKPQDTEVAKHRDKMQWMQRIQHALDNDLFELHFQPIIETSGKIPGTGLHGEILVRMLAEEDEGPALIMPSAFIPTAERFHLMPQIDKWVIRNSLLSISKNETAGVLLDLCSINLSGQSMSDMEMVDFIIEQINQTGVSPEKLCFEITESAVISNLEYARQFILKLKDIGCSFALDDFGSGLSSFDYLKNLPVDYVKLDGSLIRDVATNKVSQAMVHAINYVSHVMNMKSIAEYVEDDEILHQLRRISIDYVQGYGIGMPGLFESSRLKALEFK
jgi:diguanylate cyclase (GGDEF)-like protein